MVPPQPEAPGASCTAPDLIAALGGLPAGRVMAPIDTGGAAIAATAQQLIAGAYHRDGAGDLAMYAFYRGSPEAARGIAHDWRVTYVIACDGFPASPRRSPSGSTRVKPPAWLREVDACPVGRADLRDRCGKRRPSPSQPCMQGDEPVQWWQSRWVALAAVMLAAVPLLYPQFRR